MADEAAVVVLTMHSLVPSLPGRWPQSFPNLGLSFELSLSALEDCVTCRAPDGDASCGCCGQRRRSVLGVAHELGGRVYCGRCATMIRIAGRCHHREVLHLMN